MNKTGITKKRVLEIINSYPGETFIRQHALAINQHATDIDLIWAYTQTESTGRRKSWDYSGVKCYALPNYNRLPRWKQTIFSLVYKGRKLQKINKPQVNLIKKIKPDLVHFHFAALAVQYGHLCDKLRIPYTFSVRGSDLQVDPLIISGFQEKLIQTVTAAKAVHCVSEDLRHELFRITGSVDKTLVIRTTVSDDWESVERRPEKGLLIAIGRLHWRKGYPDLLLACKKLMDSEIEFKLVIIGEGPQRQELEFMIRDLDLKEKVELIGQKSHDEIKVWFSRAHALVLSSIAEGFPNVIAEAMMASVPVITSDCGGVTELVKDGVHAFVYQTGENNELENQLRKVLKIDEHKYLAEAAKEMVIVNTSNQVHARLFCELWK